MSSGKRKTHLLCLFYYKFKINKHFFGANQLSKFLDIGLYSAQYITKFINCQKNKLRILIVKQVNLFTGLIILLAVTSKKKTKLGLLLVNVLNFFRRAN